VNIGSRSSSGWPFAPISWEDQAGLIRGMIGSCQGEARFLSRGSPGGAIRSCLISERVSVGHVDAPAGTEPVSVDVMACRSRHVVVSWG